jgi:serine/threonine-protein kinase
MAPELLLGAAADVRTDLYAAGVVLLECLTGTTPFQRDTPRGFLARKLSSPMPAASPVSRSRRAGTAAGISVVEDTLDAIVEWMTASEAADRPASAALVSVRLAALSGDGE